HLPPDAPLNLISTTMGDSRATPRGGTIVLDLHMGLTLRNSGSRHIRGVTLLITAQEFAPGGKGSVARPSIDVSPGDNFTLPIDIRLVRPVRETAGPLVRVQLDGVLFDVLGSGGAARSGVFQAGFAGARRKRAAAGDPFQYRETGGPSAAGCFAHAQ